jgi:aldose 1-epimerase
MVATVTEVGATLRTFTVDGSDVVDGFGVDEMSSAGRGQILAPWPNRLEDGRFTRYGFEAQAALDEPARGNAIHGLVRWLPWQVLTAEEPQVELGCVLHAQPGYPWRLGLRILYELNDEGLTATLTAENVSDGPAPFGVGFHPYVTLGGPIDDAVLTIPATRRWSSDDRGLPTSDDPVAGTPYDFTSGTTIGATRLDTAFSDLTRDDDGRARVVVASQDGADRVTVWAGRGFDYLMIYTGDTVEPVLRRRRGIAIEPMTCLPNALRTGSGVIRLQPEGSWTGTWGIEI